MPVVLHETRIETPAEPPRKKVTLAERDRLDSTGLFNLNSFELIDGKFYDRVGDSFPVADAFVED